MCDGFQAMFDKFLIFEEVKPVPCSAQQIDKVDRMQQRTVGV